MLKALECESIQDFAELDKEVQQQRVEKAIAFMETSINKEVGREHGDDVENLIKAHYPTASQWDIFYPLVFYKSLNPLSAMSELEKELFKYMYLPTSAITLRKNIEKEKRGQHSSIHNM